LSFVLFVLLRSFFVLIPIAGLRLPGVSIWGGARFWVFGTCGGPFSLHKLSGAYKGASDLHKLSGTTKTSPCCNLVYFPLVVKTLSKNVFKTLRKNAFKTLSKNTIKTLSKIAFKTLSKNEFKTLVKRI